MTGREEARGTPRVDLRWGAKVLRKKVSEWGGASGASFPPSLFFWRFVLAAGGGGMGGTARGGPCECSIKPRSGFVRARKTTHVFEGKPGAGGGHQKRLPGGGTGDCEKPAMDPRKWNRRWGGTGGNGKQGSKTGVTGGEPRASKNIPKGVGFHEPRGKAGIKRARIANGDFFWRQSNWERTWTGEKKKSGAAGIFQFPRLSSRAREIGRSHCVRIHGARYPFPLGACF